MDTSFHKLDKPELLRLLGASEQGLSSLQAADSRKKHGANTIEPPKRDGVFRRILNACLDKMFIMLICAGIITACINIVGMFRSSEYDWIETIGIFVAISISVAITVIIEGRSARAFETLNKLNSNSLVKVLRDSRVVQISQSDLVVGDIVLLSSGDKLFADGRLIEAVELSADESMLTGESKASKKNAEFVCMGDTPLAERRNMVYSGTYIASGQGKMAVTGVGEKTEFGIIAKQLKRDERMDTPLQIRLSKLAKFIAFFGVSSAVTVFLMQLAIFFINGTLELSNVSNAFVTSVVLIVASVPEGLPTIIAISLALNVIKMSRENALVKRIVASETIGCVNVICSDKTGTLTQNKMHVVYANSISKELFSNIAINSTADVENGKFIGNPTECALLNYIEKQGTNYGSIRDKIQYAKKFPFSSDAKNSTVVVKEGNGYKVYTKGSPEKILDMCVLSEIEKAKIKGEIVKRQKNAERVIAFASKQITNISEKDNRESYENNLIFDGFVGMADPLREDVEKSVMECKRAGVELKMLTGDSMDTACAIANQLKLIKNERQAVTGKYIEELSQEELRRVIKDIKVVARSTPLAKMLIAKALKENGAVVAVTGDGINDAPAILEADVGIAMGSGTEVSKEASDIVLLDDSFKTVATSIKWGRQMYQNFQRFIQFQLTVNLASVLIVLAMVMLGYSTPFTALQLLWINIIMDGPPAIALGLEPIRGDIMAHRPTSRDASIVSKHMLLKIVLNGLFIVGSMLFVRIVDPFGAGEVYMSTVLFATFALFQLFNSFNAREVRDESIFKNLTKNIPFLVIVTITFALQIFITQYATTTFSTTPLPLSMWVKIIVLAFSIIPLSELIKLGVRTYKRRLK